MKLLGLILVTLFSCTALAAKKSTASTFETYHARAASSTPIDIDDQGYDQLTSAPRDYSTVVLLTALDAKFGCQLCKNFHPEWDIIAKSWHKGDKKGKGRTLFTTLDFSNGRATFMKHQLQTAPVLLLYLPTVGPNAKVDAAPLRYDFSGDVTAEQIYAWITRQLPSDVQPPLVRPVNYTRIVVAITSLLGIITFATVAYPYVLPVIQNRNLWAAISLIAVLLFTSGHMFNHIRKVPYVSGDGRGGITYFAGGFSNQFGMETQIVAAMYAVLSFATIALALKVPRMQDPKAQQIAVFIWGGVILGMYSFLLSVFKVKNGSYPFWLPPF